MKHGITFKIRPVPKPRMTQSDKWRDPPRPCVAKYWAFKSEILYEAKKQGLKKLSDELEIQFFIQMPKSWSEIKKRRMFNTKHQQKPDIDNLVKSILDIFCQDDSYVWRVTASKIWSFQNSIQL